MHTFLLCLNSCVPALCICNDITALWLFVDRDFTRHYSLSLFVWYLQSVTVVKKYSLCFAVPVVLCWCLVIISMVKITFNLIIHSCVSCGFVHRTCQSHFAKITDLIKRLQNMSSQISPFHQPKGWLPGVGLQVTYIQVFFVVFLSMGKIIHVLQLLFYIVIFLLTFIISIYIRVCFGVADKVFLMRWGGFLR